MPFVLGIGTLLVSGIFGGALLLDKLNETEEKAGNLLIPMVGVAVVVVGGYFVWREFTKR